MNALKAFLILLAIYAAGGATMHLVETKPLRIEGCRDALIRSFEVRMGPIPDMFMAELTKAATNTCKELLDK